MSSEHKPSLGWSYEELMSMDESERVEYTKRLSELIDNMQKAYERKGT